MLVHVCYTMLMLHIISILHNVNVTQCHTTTTHKIQEEKVEDPPRVLILHDLLQSWSHPLEGGRRGTLGGGGVKRKTRRRVPHKDHLRGSVGMSDHGGCYDEEDGPNHHPR